MTDLFSRRSLIEFHFSPNLKQSRRFKRLKCPKRVLLAGWVIRPKTHRGDEEAGKQAPSPPLTANRAKVVRQIWYGFCD
jgi:hypothetical protein